MDKMSPEKQLTRRDFLRVAATAAAGSLVACLPRSTAIPTPESQSPPVPPTEIPPTLEPKPTLDQTAEAIKRTTLDSNLTDVSGDVLLQGIGGEISGVFGEPKNTNPLTVTQIEAARALLGQKNAGTLYAVAGGKAVIQRLTGVKDGIDYSTLTDDKVPFKVTVTMLPNTFLQADGERIILPEKTKPGEARYLKTNDQTEWNVASTFLVDPGFLPTGAAFWWDMSGMNLRPVMWDGKGNPRLMGNLQVEVKPFIAEVPTPVATENTEATKQAQFEAKKAEALKMVSIKLDSPEDFKTLPVLDDVADFDSGKVQAEEYWLIENVLPPADVTLPQSWAKSCNNATGFCGMDYNHTSEGNVKTYRGVGAFFVMRDGKKMLRLGVEFGGPGQLIHFNFEDPKWWTDPVRMKTLLAAFNCTDIVIEPISQYGSENGNWLTLVEGYLTDTDASSTENYTKKVTLERSKGGNQFAIDWARNRQLPEGADKSVFGARFNLVAK